MSYDVVNGLMGRSASVTCGRDVIRVSLSGGTGLIVGASYGHLVSIIVFVSTNNSGMDSKARIGNFTTFSCNFRMDC
jgi:hypothetical protein